ncbi:unnamed protein product [Somion occarium]|uniref:Chromo domain-containing protein n=1 Tax=Somion occarium TaxID=3059160 RepID=A0ABP1D9V0_9APHY
MSEQEFEVENILQAQVGKKHGKRGWLYLVKWKGYNSEEDNTWEPTESFDEGSQHFIETFWARAREDRDYNDISLFKSGEVIIPVGPPPKRRNLNKRPVLNPKPAQPVPGPSMPADSESEVKSLIEENSSPRRNKRQNAEVDEPIKTPVTKRKKGRKEVIEVDKFETPQAKKSSLSRQSSVSKQKKRRGPPGIRPDALQNQEGPSSSRQKLVEMTLSDDEANNADVEKMITVPDATNSPTHGSLFGDDSEPEPLPVGPPKKRKTQPEPQLLPIGPPKKRVAAQAKSDIPAHRARKNNPRVKLLDDNVFPEGYDGAIATKARFLSSKAGSSSTRDNTRVSNGVISGSTSLLTAAKGKLQTMTGKVKGLLGVSSQDDTISVPTSDPNEDVLMIVDQDPATLVASEPPAPSVPSAKELLDMAGFDAAAAQELSDFEDGDEPAVPAETTANPGEKEEESEVSPTAPAESPSVGSGHVFSAGWRSSKVLGADSTIFGPLSYSRSTLGLSTGSAEPNHSKKLLSIKLDSATDVPVVLKDVQPPLDPRLKPLDEVIAGATEGPSGKFYKGENAPTLIATLRVEGSCARVALDDNVSEVQKKDFERFRTRLQSGELFVITVGSSVLALCSSENHDLCTKLGMSPKLVGLGDNVLVTEVVIENDGAFCDAVLHAEDERW